MSQEECSLYLERYCFPWLPTLKWGWDGADSDSTPFGGSVALHAAEPPEITTASHMVLHHRLRLWPANSPAAKKDQLCKMFQVNLLLFGWIVHQSSSTLIMHTNRRTVVHKCMYCLCTYTVCLYSDWHPHLPDTPFKLLQQQQMNPTPYPSHLKQWSLKIGSESVLIKLSCIDLGVCVCVYMALISH